MGWDDEGGDPVFVAVQASGDPTGSAPFQMLVEPVARQIMKAKLGEDPGPPDYIIE